MPRDREHPVAGWSLSRAKGERSAPAPWQSILLDVERGDGAGHHVALRLRRDQAARLARQLAEIALDDPEILGPPFLDREACTPVR